MRTISRSVYDDDDDDNDDDGDDDEVPRWQHDAYVSASCEKNLVIEKDGSIECTTVGMPIEGTAVGGLDGSMLSVLRLAIDSCLL